MMTVENNIVLIN